MTRCPSIGAPESTFPALEPQDVHVWALDLDDKPAAGTATFLDEDERSRARAYLDPEHGRRFARSRGGLRLLLGCYLDEAPESLCFTRGPAGKPALAGDSRSTRLRFSVAHSSRLALYAVASGREVGIDVERLLPERVSLRIADAFFTPREAARIRGLPEPIRARAFFERWTRREALLKATGEGLGGLDAHDFHRNVPGRWRLRDIHVAADYAAALAVEGRSDFRLRLFGREPGAVSPRHVDGLSAEAERLPAGA